MGTPNDVTVLLVDDHEIVRSGLRALLDRQEGVSVVGEASSGRKAVEQVKELSPDVVVMDLSMPELNGIDATRQVISLKPDVKVIGLSAHNDDRMNVEMLRAGASGFVFKVAAFDELVLAIRSVVQGKVYFSPRIIAKASEQTDESNGAYGALSQREREVLQLLAEGKATKEVAAALHVSVKTVETHRRNLMEKLQMDSVAELTKYAIREGLTSV